MKKLYNKLIAGIATTLVVYGIFFGSQVVFAQNYDKKLVVKADSMNREVLLRLKDEVIQSLELKVEVMERYVEAGQKNLDLWLKMLVLLLSLLMGLTVFNGLRMRDMAKDELEEIRRIKDDIRNLAIDAEERLKSVKSQLSQIEVSSANASLIKESVTQQLNDIGFKTDQVLSDAQKKTVEESIARTKEDLQKKGIESLKNLYFAKGLKAFSDKKWEDVIRLMSSSVDLDEKNHVAFFNRGVAFLELSKMSSDAHVLEFINKSIIDFTEVIRLRPDHSLAFNNRGIALTMNSEHEKAVSDFNEAIRLQPNVALYFISRAATYKKMGMDSYAEIDLTKARELEGSKPPLLS